MKRQQKVNLAELARQAMIDRGLEPDFNAEIQREVKALREPAYTADSSVRDLRKLPWCSIDNDDSRDLDQLTWAEPADDGSVRVLVAVADVDILVPKGSAIDARAAHNTTSVYTAARIFPMLPEELSTDMTSLNEHEERFAMIAELTVLEDGHTSEGEVYFARVYNHAKLAYNRVASWLDGEEEMPEKVARVKGLAETIQLQDKAADKMRARRHENGALDLETIEPRAVMRDGEVVELRREKRNNARLLIEDFMISANGVTARFLERKGFSSIRRVVRSPERWDRIERIAEELGERLPPEPDAQALEEFLVRRRKADPMRFPDLSLSVVKAMGAGEYVLERAGEDSTGHFGLAVRDYAHSTAPNRRYPDLITQRLVKAAIAGASTPYTDAELHDLATHCTAQEDAANKVERQIRKSAAALLLHNRIGEHFEGVVTGASAKGTWARVFDPPVEGRIVRGEENLDLGDRVRVKLLSVDVERGYIDFARAHR
ncbi:MAG TPA: RNB domain-containing ribonuclease [Thermoanaerobaculia bacterium]|nr:RNB domain-containing ribonuclease [Thermoanaerobaculia bacterium]